jgi:predicted ABC-type ATPase
MPVLHLIAGPNGAGKTTLYRTLIGPRYPGLPFINPDIYEAEHLQGEGNPRRRSELARAWADATRAALLREGEAFVTETVFSHPSKLELLAQARVHGFATVLYVVCVDQPSLLLGRVRGRVQEGGHDVPPDKIITRYPRTLALLKDARAAVDVAFLFDGSDIEIGGPVLIASIAGGRMNLHTALRPRWVEKVLGFAER